MLIGLHVSAAGGVQNAPKNAHDLKCEVFQFFTRSPQGGPAPKLTPEIISSFKTANKQFDIPRIYVHTPYFINFASANAALRKASIAIVRQELERSASLGVTAMMTHLGSAKDIPKKQALKFVATAIKTILKGYNGSTIFLLENSAGAGQVIGDTLDELAFLLKSVFGSKLSAHSSKLPLGICLDTCHAFASGYDLRTKTVVDAFIKKVDKLIGLSYLKLIHANDSMANLGEKKDRHEHIGKGKIGLKGFQALAQHPKLKNVDMIVETPHDGRHISDLTTLKRFRNN
jgi:deoxyribonuclease IV